MRKHIFQFMLAMILVFLPLHASGSTEQAIEAINQVSANNKAKQTDTISDDMASLTSLYRYVDSLYYEDVDKEAVKQKMAEAMIEALGDKYSFYTPPEDSANYEEEVTGQYGGIGVYLTKQNPKNINPDDPSTYMITIESTMPGTPAQRAGLRSHDMISAIDGEEVNLMTSTEASKKLRGVAGTTVTVTVNRNGQTFDITLKRETIDKPIIQSTMLEGNIGYIAINEYTSSTSTQLLKALRDLRSQEMHYLIIDERFNGGGNVDECMKCANMFLDAGKTIVSLEGRKGSNSNKVYTASSTSQVSGDVPIVILVNGGSASASEIFAAALHDNKRATLIGTKTFGKGIFQSVFPYGEGFVQITTGHYYTPNGICIHGTGIEPDIEVKDQELSDDELPSYETMLKEGRSKKYVDDHPEFTPENMDGFIDQEKDCGIRPEILRLIIRNEYLGRMDYDAWPVADPTYDPPLQRAIEFLRDGK